VKFELSAYASLEAVNHNDFWLSADQYRDAIALYAPSSNLDKGNSTDWVNEVTQKPINQNYNLGITGGRDNIAYRANITYMDDQGLFKGNYSRIVSPSIFITQNAFNNRLTLDYKLLYSITNSSDIPGDLWYQTVTRNPTEPVYDPTNTGGNGYYDNHIQGSKNPVAMLNESTMDRKINFINAGFNADFKLIENLALKLSASYNNWYGSSGQYQTRYYPLLGKTGEAYTSSWETNILTIEPSISYKFDLLDNHHFQVMTGYSYTERFNSNASMTNGNFDTDKFSYHNIGAGKDIIDGLASMTSFKESNKLIAFYGRATYNYKDKYLASVSLRYEGSSRFGANNKWGAFPAFSAGWRLNEEKFMEGITWLDDLKIRAGVGVTGNQDIPNYQSIPTLSTRQGDSGGLFYYNGEWVNVYVPDNNPNPDLKWEKKTEYNLGIDFGLFNRLTGTIDLYKRSISDLLWYYNVPVPPNIYNYVYANVGEMTNKGIELQLRADIIRKSNFIWNSILTYSKNINELTKLSDPSRGYELEYIKYTPAATTWAQLLREGEPVGNYWAPIYIGMDEDGKPLYEDIDGGGVDVNSIGDRRIVGNDYPDFEMGWQNSLSYKEFFFTFSFRAIVGQSLLNWDRMSYENLRPLSNGYNILSSTLDHPEYVSEITYDSRFVDNASFVKLDNLVFGYDFKLGLNNLRLYVSGSNLLTITNFNGNDPEQTIPGFNTDTEKFGGDNLTYPYSRTFLLGLKFNF
jgi:TonB-linked SusC/RagA family outer membrane protein